MKPSKAIQSNSLLTCMFRFPERHISVVSTVHREIFSPASGPFARGISAIRIVEKPSHLLIKKRSNLPEDGRFTALLPAEMS